MARVQCCANTDININRHIANRNRYLH
jgi:hypothetical protein